MRRDVVLVLVLFAVIGRTFGQDAGPTATPHRRSWLGRILHPFSPEVVPQYKDPRLRGLALDLQIAPQTVKLSEVRQLEINLRNSAGDILTKWSDNHAITQKSATVLINQQEHVEYNETIATRDLTPNKVFVAEAFFPAYPELRIRQKFLAVP